MRGGKSFKRAREKTERAVIQSMAKKARNRYFRFVYYVNNN